MTITSPYSPVSFPGSGTTGPFDVPFRLLDKADVVVQRIAIDGTVTTLSEGIGSTQYQITLLSGGITGARFTLTTALAIGERLVAARRTPRTQMERLANLTRFNPEIHEKAFDKATMLIQENESEASSALKFPTADTPGLNQFLPVDTARAGKVMGFDAQGQPIASALSVSQLDDFANGVIAVQNNKNATDANVVTTNNNVTAAQNAQAAAEAAAAGIRWRPSVRASTTGPLPTVTYSNGTAGVGATLTATANGALASQDGVSLTVGQRLLVKDQVTQLQNGVYSVTQVGSGGTPFILMRATDADAWIELVSQAIIIEEGSTLADMAYICTVNQGGTIGTNNVTWAAFNPPIADGSITPQKLSFAPRGYIDGFTMSTAGSSTTMSIGAGQAADSSATVFIIGSAINKTTASWAVGSGNGGIDTGSIANSTWYYFYAIRRPDTGVTDVIFSLSSSAPSMPTNYTQYRRIGAGRTDGSGNWTRFVQNGDEFDWYNTVSDISQNSPGTSAVTRTLTVPSVAGIIAKIQGGVYGSTQMNLGVLFTPLDVADEEPTAYNGSPPNSDVAGFAVSATVLGRSVVVKNVKTNGSAQIRSRTATGGAETTITIRTIGWIDRRGKQ